MRNFIYVFFIILGILVVFYLSWVSSPKLANNLLIPNWMASWIDSYKFNTIRTAIPMVLLGSASGSMILFNRLERSWWLHSWILLSIVVLIAEIGQFLKPLRSFDIEDVFFGSLGAALGLLIVAISPRVIKLLNLK